MNKLTLSLERTSLLEHQIHRAWPLVAAPPSPLAQRPDAEEDEWEGSSDDSNDDEDDWDDDEDDWDEDDDDWDEDEDDDWDEDDDSDDSDDSDDPKSLSPPRHRSRRPRLDEADILPVEARFKPHIRIQDETPRIPRRFQEKGGEDLPRKKKETIRRPIRTIRPDRDRSNNDDIDWED